MATTVSYNGTNYTVPQSGDSGWGTTLTTYLVALASGSLTKAGGLMTLTAELDLGANFGIRSIYFAGRSTPATAGLVRLGNTQAISWRNAANDANLDLLVNASNNLTWKNIFKIQNTGSGFSALAHDTQGLELESTAMNATSKYCPPIKFMCADTDIVTNNPRCIAYIVGRTAGTVNSDITPTGVLEFATLPGGEAAATMPTVRATIDQNGNFGVANLAGSGSRLVRASAAAGNLSATAADIVNADINASAAIAYSKLNLATSIVNADISASAAIEGSKLVAASASVAGAMTTGTQTIAGAKTFTGNFYMGANATALSGVTAMHTSTTASGAVQLTSVTDTSKGAWLYFTKSRGSIGSETIVSDDDEVGSIFFYALGAGASASHVASIRCYVDGEPGTAGDVSDTPGRLVFCTSSDGASNATERMTLGSDGILVLNNGAKMDDDADQDALNYYRTENVSLDWQFNGTGPGAAVSNTTRITRIGNIVHFHLGTARATTGTGSTILSSVAWPTWAWPVRQTVIKGVHIRNNGASDATSIGCFQINSTDGIASIYRDLSLTAFANATNCGVQTSFSGCYAIE